MKRVSLSVCAAAGWLTAGAQELSQLPIAASESRHFELVSSTSADRRALGEKFDEVFEVVTNRLGLSLEEKIKVAFDAPNPGPCRSRAWTMVPPPGAEDGSLPLIVIFADENTDEKQIIGALAHELGHVLEYLVIDGGRSIESIFVEGFATWAAGNYWLDWQNAASFRSAIASYIAEGAYLPLHENDGFPDTLSEAAAAQFGDSCLRRRDVIYTEWAAFIEYLVQEYGRPKLYSLFQAVPELRDGEADPIRRPNFLAVYGKSLERLEAEWREWAMAQE